MTLQNLSNEELLPVARAFNQFLNLTNVAEQYHSISPHGEAASNPVALAALFDQLKAKNFTNEEMRKAVDELSIELVLTAHPTEIARRTLIHKLVAVNTCTVQLDHDDRLIMSTIVLCAVCANWWHRHGILMKSAKTVRHRLMKRSGALPWWKNSLWGRGSGVPARV